MYVFHQIIVSVQLSWNDLSQEAVEVCVLVDLTYCH